MGRKRASQTRSADPTAKHPFSSMWSMSLDSKIFCEANTVTSPSESRTRGRRTLGGAWVSPEGLVPYLPSKPPRSQSERWPPSTHSDGLYLQQKIKTMNTAMTFIPKETRRSRVPGFHLHLPVQLLLGEEVKEKYKPPIQPSPLDTLSTGLPGILARPSDV